MKKITLLATLLVAFTFTTSNAQNIKLIDPKHGDVTNKTVTVQAPVAQIEVESHLDVKNNTTSKMQMLVRKKIKSKDTLSGTVAFFCWNNCYSASVYLSLDTISFNPGEERKDMFKAYLQFENIPGKNTVSYTFLSLNGKDSVTVTYNYDITTGIKDVALNKLDVYPTPASNLLYMNLPANTSAVNVELADITGKTIRRLQPKEGQKNDQVVLNVEGLPNGVYFLNVYNEHFHGTKKVIISN